MFQDTLLQQSFNSYFFDLHESPLDSPLTIFCFQRSEAARPEQVFYTKPGCVQYLCEVGHTYTEQDPRLYEAGYSGRHPAFRSRIFGVVMRLYRAGHSEQRQRQYTGIVHLFEIGYLIQLCLISDSGEKLKHVFLFLLTQRNK